MGCAVLFSGPTGTGLRPVPGSYSHTALRGIQDIGLFGAWAGLRNTKYLVWAWANNPVTQLPRHPWTWVVCSTQSAGLEPAHTPDSATQTRQGTLSGALITQVASGIHLRADWITQILRKRSGLPEQKGTLTLYAFPGHLPCTLSWVNLPCTLSRDTYLVRFPG